MKATHFLVMLAVAVAVAGCQDGGGAPPPVVPVDSAVIIADAPKSSTAPEVTTPVASCRRPGRTTMARGDCDVDWDGRTDQAEEEYPPAVTSAGEAVYQVNIHGGSGTGFFVASSLLVTNFHVIDTISDIDDISLLFDGEPSPVRAKRLVAVSLPYDLALIQTEGASSTFLAEGPEPQDDEIVFTAGYPARPASSEGTRSNAIDLQYHRSVPRTKRWEDMYHRISFLFKKWQRQGAGSSGSPFLNSQGQFIGVHYAGAPEPSARVYAIHPSWIRELSRKATQYGTVCRKDAPVCIGTEVSRAQELVRSFMAGTPVEERHLGFVYYTPYTPVGWKLEKRAEEAYLIKKAKEFEDAEAQYQLGELARARGYLEEAVHWLTLSAKQGMPLAQYNLGLILYNSGHILDVQRPRQEAALWYEKSAKQGTRLAQYNLGVILDKQGDLKEAACWYEKAAEQGLADAQNNLGVILDKQGDLEEAACWFKKAAEQELADAPEQPGGRSG